MSMRNSLVASGKWSRIGVASVVTLSLEGGDMKEVTNTIPKGSIFVGMNANEDKQFVYRKDAVYFLFIIWSENGHPYEWSKEQIDRKDAIDLLIDKKAADIAALNTTTRGLDEFMS